MEHGLKRTRLAFAVAHAGGVWNRFVQKIAKSEAAAAYDEC